MKVGDLSVKISADTSGLQTGLKNSAVAVAAFGVAAASAFGVMVKNSINAADELSKLSQKVGITVEQLSGLKHAAALSDVSMQGLQTATQRFSAAIVDAKNGVELQSKAFEKMRISVTNTDGSLRSNYDLMLDVSDAMAKMKDGAEKTDIAMQFFGKAGADLIPLLNGGREAILGAHAEAERMGKIFTTEAAQGAEAFNDSLTRLKGSITGVADKTAVAMLPAMNDLVDIFDDPAFQQGIADVATKLIEFVVNVIEAGRAIGFLVDEVKEFFGVIAEDDIVRMQEQIEKLREQAGETWFGGNVFNVEEIDKKIAELESKIAAAQKRIVDNWKSTGGATGGVTGGDPEAEGAGIIPPAITGTSFDDAVGNTTFETPESVQDRLDAIFAVKTADYERELEAHREQTDAFLEQVRQGGMTRQEIEIEQEQARLERLQEIADDEYATEEQRQAARLALLQAAKDAEQNLAAENAAARLAIEQDMWKNMMGLMNSSSRAMFEVGKVASIAQALIAARESVVNAYNFGSRTGGPWLGAAYAATAAAAQAANIMRIKNTQFGSSSTATAGSGGTAPLVSNSGGGGGESDGGGSSRIFNIQLAGQTQSTESVRALIELINEQVGNGAVLRVT
jgi:hypothetical protein